MKVVWLTEIPTVYRTPLFERLRTELELSVLYCAASDPWRGPALEIDPDGEVLPGFGFGGRRGGGPNWKVNLSVWKRLTSTHPHVVVVAGYAHPTMLLAILWCRRHGVPYILHSESHNLTPRSTWKKRVKAPLVSWVVRNASSYLPVSSPAASYLEEWGGDRARMFILPNSPDVEEIVNRTRLQPNLDTAGFTFLFVGRLVDAKAPALLIDAFDKVRETAPSARLVVAGDGPLRTALETDARVRGMNVSFEGHVSSDNLIDLYGKADCFVLPSIYEPYGVVVQEAMAAGLPAIVSDRVGSAADLVVDGATGYVVPVGDVEALARRMTDVIRKGRRHFEDEARATAGRWNYDFGVKSAINAMRLAVGADSPL